MSPRFLLSPTQRKEKKATLQMPHSNFIALVLQVDSFHFLLQGLIPAYYLTLLVPRSTIIVLDIIVNCVFSHR